MTGAILAGGRSTRMQGLDKTQLTVQGTRVIETLAAMLRRVCAECLVVARDAEQAAALALPDQRTITDHTPDCGPLGGIHAAMDAAQDDVFVLACDLPYVRAQLLHSMKLRFDKAALTNDASEAPSVVLPRTADGRDQPLCAIWSRRCLPVLDEALRKRQFALYRVLQMLTSRGCGPLVRVELSATESSQLHNINTPSDLDPISR
jgi:molybdopterin-guanine dinucleotide biosynthesis protein A